MHFLIRLTLCVFCFALHLESSFSQSNNDVLNSSNYQKITEFFEQNFLEEQWIGDYTWVSMYPRSRAEVPNWNNCTTQDIRDYSASVVRLHNRLGRICNKDVSQMSTADLESELNDTEGCTAWRFSKTIFVTAWHCMAHDEVSCSYTEIGFDYNPKLSDLNSPSFNASKNWQGISEKCIEILYSNQVLDVVFFRVDTLHYPNWGHRKELPVLPGVESYPTDSDRLFILQHPTPGKSGCRTYAAQELEIYQGYQMEQQLAIWSRDDTGCRLVSRKGKYNWYSGTNPYPPNICQRNRVNGYSGPNISIVHRCDTCPSSSGSPILSLDGGNGRACTVIGLHVRKTTAGVFEDDRAQFIEANVGLRFSVLGECVDFAASKEADHIVLVPGEKTKNHPECKAVIPNRVQYLDCLSEENRNKQVCAGYWQDQDSID